LSKEKGEATSLSLLDRELYVLDHISILSGEWLTDVIIYLLPDIAQVTTSTYTGRWTSEYKSW